MNHEPLNTGSRERYGLAFGEAVLMSSPPSRSQTCAGTKHQDFAESGFGGWADEKMKTVREAAPMLSAKKIHPQHLTISPLNVVDKTMMRRPINYVIEADIKRFFDNVPHSWMIRCLQVRIKDPSLLLIIRRFLEAGYIDAGEFVLTTEGTPQGSNFSPIISNIFLHYVLDLWFEKKIKPKVRGVCQLVRYADDFICMTQYANDARHIEQVMRERFTKFDLELHPEKTRIISLDREQRCRMNRKDHQSHTFDFLGFTHYWGRSRKGNPTLHRKTSAKKFRKACKEMNLWLWEVRCTMNLKEWWQTLRSKLRGHYQYYGISGNSRAIERYHYVTKRLVFKWINRRSQKASFNWKGFNAYLEHYPLPEPRIVHHLYTLSFVS